MNTFKDGDLVYFPKYTKNICILKKESPDPLLCAYDISDVEYFNHFDSVYQDGKIYEDDEVPSVFHANESNKKITRRFVLCSVC